MCGQLPIPRQQKNCRSSSAVVHRGSTAVQPWEKTTGHLYQKMCGSKLEPTGSSQLLSNHINTPVPCSHDQPASYTHQLTDASANCTIAHEILLVVRGIQPPESDYRPCQKKFPAKHKTGFEHPTRQDDRALLHPACL